ncbi:MAG: peptidase BlaR1 [Caulobacteraceae bacterium]|nr:peptidase BlaR1 [Caulobacteraceae bacterium]
MTIADLLPRLAAVSLAASAAVLVVLALRLPLRRFIGAHLSYGLWLLVPIAMLGSVAPVPSAMDHAIGQLFHPAAVSAIGRVVDQTTIVIVEPAGAEGATAGVVAKTLDLAPLLYAWVIGAAGFSAYLVFGQRRAIARFGLLGRDAAGFTRAASREAGPALIGLVWPRIILPSDFEQRFGLQERKLILAHELTHLRHGDLWINGLAALIQTLNWFNPLVHLAAHLLRVDQELACDAAVVAKFPGERRTYAEALLKSQQACIPMPLGCHWPGRSPQRLQERLTMLAHHQPTRIRLLTGGALIGALCLAAGAAAWAASPVRTTAATPTPNAFAWAGASPARTAAPGAMAYASAAPTRAAAASPAMAYAPAGGPGGGSGMTYAAASSQDAPSTIGMACFSNSCAAPSAAGPRDAAAVSAAVKAGDAKAVVAAGGSADDVLAAWNSADVLSGRPQPTGRPNDRVIPGSAEFVSTANGVLAVRSQIEGGGTMIMARGDALSSGDASQLVMDVQAGTAGGQVRRTVVSPDGQVSQNVLVLHASDGQGGGPTILAPPGGYATVTIQDVRSATPSPGGGAAYLTVRPGPIQAGQ